MLRRDFLINGIAASGAGGLASSALRAAAGAAPLRPINIVGTSGTTTLVMSALLNRMGYLTELGVAPNFINVGDGTKVVAALVTGAADICPQAGFTQVLAAIEKGAPLKIVAGSADKNFNAVFSNNPAVKTLKDLEGRSVGVGSLGTQLHQMMIALFRRYGVDSSRVRFANVGASVDVFKAVTARVVDAGPSEVWLQHGSTLHIVENGKTFEALPQYVNQASFASDRAIAQKRDLIVRTLAAYARLYRFIMSGDSEAAFIAASAAALGKNDPEAARAQWQFYRDIKPFAPNLSLDEDRLKYMQELNMITGTQKTLMPYNKVADMSMAREALMLLK
jgi:ABC-type nitrate/sulfonate/bicarbonate transport system substrate-binding protein